MGEKPSDHRGKLYVRGSAPRREDFLGRVERVCRLREGEGVQIEREDASEPFGAFLRVSKVERGVIDEYPVAALDQRVDQAIVDAFLIIVAPFREEDPAVSAQLVYRGELAPQELVRYARRRGVRLVSFEEYRGLIDFRRYLAWQATRIERNPLYASFLYVEQRAQLGLGREDHEVDSALSTIMDLFDTNYGRFVLVLGDFGTGKTFLLHQLARRLSDAKELGLVPVLIEMRALEKARSFDALIAQHLSLSEIDRIDLAAFRYMLAEGRIALLFDGFDELALRVSYERATEHFETLIEAAQGHAKVIVTSRSQQFLTDDQVRSVLATRAAELHQYRLIKLRPFTPQQIKYFLIHHLKDEDEAQARFDLLDEVKDLLGLSANPRMLSFIADVPVDQLREAKERSGTITSAELYRLLIERWLKFEDDRAHPKGALPGLSVTQRRKIVTDLALRLWNQAERTVHVHDIPPELVDAVNALAAYELDPHVVKHQVGSGTLLVRDESDNFSFIHQSVLEWLVASAAANEVKATGDSPTLSHREMSDLMSDFFAALAGKNIAIRWSERALGADSGYATTNALHVLRRLEVNTPEELDLAGRDLRGQDLSNRNLRRANLHAADLSEAVLVGADLTGANLQNAKLRRSNLNQARLAGADLRGADLSFASLLGADLRRAKLDGSILKVAKLVGAKVDACALDNSNTQGAALATSNAIDVMLSSASRCTDLAWSPDGILVASTHGDGSISLWDAATSTMLRVLHGHEHMVTSVAFSPDGNILATGSDDGTMRLWDAATGTTLRVLSGHEGWVMCVAFNPDGTVVASGSADCVLRLWESKSGTLVHELNDHRHAVASVAWHPTGALLATGSYDRKVRLWDPIAGTLHDVLTGHGGGVHGVAWNPTGTLLASASSDGTIRVWDMNDATLWQVRPQGIEDPDTVSTDSDSSPSRRVLRGHRLGVRCARFSPDGFFLATGSSDGMVMLWDVASGTSIRTFKGHDNWVQGIAFSPDGTKLGSASSDATVRIWDLSTATAQILSRHDPWLSCATFCRDGTAFARGSHDGSVQLWLLQGGAVWRTLRGHPHLSVASMAFSPDGRLLVTASSRGTLRMWDVSTGDEINALRRHLASVEAIAFSSNGKIMATGSEDRTIRLWNPVTAKETGVLEGHATSTLSIAFSPDGNIIAGGCGDGSLRLWDMTKLAPMHVLHGSGTSVSCVAFSPDGQQIASGSADVTLWSRQNASMIRTFVGHQTWVRIVVFSPDGRILASGSNDCTVRLWDVATGTCLHVLRGHSGPVVAMAFSPDGSKLQSASEDGTFRIWDVNSGVWDPAFLPLPNGSVVFTPDGRYRIQGVAAGVFWHAINLCRFEPGELDPYLSRPLQTDDLAYVLPSQSPPPVEIAENGRPSYPDAEARSAETPRHITVLFLGANPSDTTRLSLDREVREIVHRLRAAPYYEQFQLVQEWAVRVDDLQACLLRHRPDVVHFSGHGKSAGELMLEDEHGAAFAIGKDALARLFQLLKRNVRCVVLNACFSAEQARAIACHIECVVGMTSVVEPAARITFAGAFYQALGFGASVGEAFALGCNSVDLRALAGADVPHLLIRPGTSANDISFVINKT